MKIFLIIAIQFFLLSGCATKVSQSNLYWGEYSRTLYNTKKEPSPSSNAEHEKELNEIVEKSKNMRLRVPPGVYAELGIFSNDRGDYEQAKAYFKLEQENYPKAEVLMKRTLNNSTQVKTI